MDHISLPKQIDYKCKHIFVPASAFSHCYS